MSNTIASLSRKIGSAAELQSVVRAMKALAGASVGQYEQSVRALADYYRALELGLAVCLRDSGPSAQASRFGAAAAPQPSVAVVFGSDQGLVGQFNEVITRYSVAALTQLSSRSEVWAVGERVHAHLVEAGMAPNKCFRVPTSVHTIAPLIEQILVANAAQHSENLVSSLLLFHNQPRTDATCAPTSQRLLPLDERWLRQHADLPWPSQHLPEAIGSPTVTLRALIREHLFVSLFKACAESLASENQTRLSAMQRAEKNIDELLDQLHQSFHRLRQSSIDEELFDVISGSEALNNSGR